MSQGVPAPLFFGRSLVTRGFWTLSAQIWLRNRRQIAIYGNFGRLPARPLRIKPVTRHNRARYGLISTVLNLERSTHETC